MDRSGSPQPSPNLAWTTSSPLRSPRASAPVPLTGDAFPLRKARSTMLSRPRKEEAPVPLLPSAPERLREKHHIYMMSDSRMNLAGLMPHNVEYVAEAIAAEH